MSKDTKTDDTLIYQDVSIDSLPSRGNFYKAGTRIAIRAATSMEIKEYSSMDVNEPLESAAAIKKIINRCTKVTSGGGSRIDNNVIKEVDKICILLMIRDLTMTKNNRHNDLTLPVTCENCGKPAKIKIDHSSIGFVDIDDKIMKYYDESRAVLSFKHESIGEEEIVISFPSMGTVDAITSYMKYKLEKKRDNKDNHFFDKNFLTYLQFIIIDHQKLGLGIKNIETNIDNMYKKYSEWSQAKHELIVYLSDELVKGIDPNMSHDCSVSKGGCGHVSYFPIRLKNIKSIFNISGVVDGLFSI